ncbi:MAG: hypothetical protein K2X41_04715 [Hyphomicrobium sp.]|nr:hypothetical protein [Hyphomicrobium sp.]
MDVATPSNLWALTGSVYAIAGAALLWAAALASPLSVSMTDTTAAASQRIDARFGGGLLTFGLFLQAIGTAANSASLGRPATFMLAGLAFLLLFYALARDMMIVETSAETIVAEATIVPAPADGMLKPQLITQAEAPMELEDMRTVVQLQR